MTEQEQLDEIKKYFQDRLDTYGTSPRGADWNSSEAQNIRFAQLARVIVPASHFTVLDFGCGYGAFADFLLEQKMFFTHFYGFDILDTAIKSAVETHPQTGLYSFSADWTQIPEVDYSVASGVFNIRLDTPYDQWTMYVLECLGQMDQKSRKGFASNFLTKYSDPEKMASRLYYADPCMLFDYCKKNFSRNVAILHDYGLYDFTIIVRKF